MIKRPKSDPREPAVSEAQRDTLLALIRERVAAVNGLEGYDPVVALALIATDPVVNGLAPDPLYADAAHPEGQLRRDRRLAVDAHKEVARYPRPQLKQVEVTGAGGGPLVVQHGLASEIADLIAGLTQTTAERTEKA